MRGARHLIGLLGAALLLGAQDLGPQGKSPWREARAFLLSACAGTVPSASGKDFQGETYFVLQDRIVRFKENSQGRLMPLPDLPVPHGWKAGSRWVGGKHWRREAQAVDGWIGDRAIGSKLNCAFGDFLPLMEGRTLLINTVDTDDYHRGHFLEWVSLPSGIREVAQPWPDAIYRQTFSDPFVYGYWTAYECMGIEEFGVVYGR